MTYKVSSWTLSLYSLTQGSAIGPSVRLSVYVVYRKIGRLYNVQEVCEYPVGHY